jgi:hypothetical protein
MIVRPATVQCNIMHGSAGLNIETFKEVIEASLAGEAAKFIVLWTL